MNMATKPASHMTAEILEAPEAVARQETSLAGPLRELVRRLKAKPPQVVVTVARGSSAHAAAFAKHAIERHLGIPVAAAAPSIVTVYHRDLNLKDQLLLAISQSGRSDDLIEQTRSARRAGALTVALVNAADSPLAAESDIVLPIGAGLEQSIAATKSFIATLAALLRLTAEWAENDALAAAISRLPERLKAAADLDWSACFGAFAPAPSLMVIGRGSTLAIAREAALKLKETCNLHAEGYSGAEFQHGPMALVAANYPILMFMPTDAAKDALVALGGRSAPQTRGGLQRRAGRGRGALAGASAGSAGGRCHLPDTKLLCGGRAFGETARRWTRTGRAISTRSRAHDDGQAIRGRRGGDLRRRGLARGLRGDRRGRAHRRPRAARRSACGACRPRAPRGRMARARLHRCAGEWRRRRPLQQRADARRDRRHCRRASAIRHDGLLPTLITDSDETMRAARAAVDAAMQTQPGVLGIHFEGPFLSPEKPGVHDPHPDARAQFLASRAAHRICRRHARHPGAGARAGRLHPLPRRPRCSRLARPFHGDLRADACRHGRWPDRLYSPLQRHAARWRRASRGPSRRRWKRPAAGTG